MFIHKMNIYKNVSKGNFENKWRGLGYEEVIKEEVKEVTKPITKVKKATTAKPKVTQTIKKEAIE